MSFRMLSLAFAAALVFVAGPASAARIIVTIDGLHTAQGTVFVGLYASPAKFLQGNQADAQRRVKASTGPITVAFDNPAPAPKAVGTPSRSDGGICPTAAVCRRESRPGYGRWRLRSCRRLPQTHEF